MYRSIVFVLQTTGPEIYQIYFRPIDQNWNFDFDF